MSAEPRIQNFRSTHHCLSLQCKAMVLVLSQVGAVLAKWPLKKKRLHISFFFFLFIAVLHILFSFIIKEEPYSFALCYCVRQQVF